MKPTLVIDAFIRYFLRKAQNDILLEFLDFVLNRLVLLKTGYISSCAPVDHSIEENGAK